MDVNLLKMKAAIHDGPREYQLMEWRRGAGASGAGAERKKKNRGSDERSGGCWENEAGARRLIRNEKRGTKELRPFY